MDWGIVQGPVRQELDLVDDLFEELFRSPIEIVRRVAEHFLATRGKKFRPTLLLLISRLRGKTNRTEITSAAVVELIHAAALIHDDSVDRSALRRGLPTVNRMWNDNVAIVMGDFLYSKAFETMVREELYEAMAIMANVTHHMSIGMALEIEHEGSLDVSESIYLDIIAAKTASLVEGACNIGALNNGKRMNGDQDRSDRCRKFGEAVGMAFQINDDIVDYLGDPAETGKKPGTDLREGKVTLPLIRALSELRGAKQMRTGELAEKRKLKKSEFQELVELIEVGDGFRYAMSRATDFADLAKSYLSQEPEGEIRDALELSVEYSVTRTS